MNIQNMMEEMFLLQDKLNIQTNGKQWREGITSEGRKINWKRCIYMEGAELLDSFNWKHWKDINKSDNLENAEIELVDIWHFCMSSLIEVNHKSFSIAEIAEIAFLEYEKIEEKFDNRHPSTLVELAENIIKSAVNGRSSIAEFFCMTKAMPNFKFKDIYRLYIGKNCLNQFRQDNGYKDGTYSKIWRGEEDNVHMQRIINDFPEISYDTLYQELTESYAFANTSIEGKTVVNGMRQILDS